MRTQRLLQSISLLIFASVIATAAAPFGERLLLAWLLAFDPAASLGTFLAARAIFAGIGAALLLLLATSLFGRFFCGHLCPLGSFIDLSDRVAQRKNRSRPNLSRLRSLTFLLLFGAAAGGVSLLFLAAPLAIATRFTALLLEPLAREGVAAALDLARPAAHRWSWDLVVFAQIRTPGYQPLAPLLILTLAPLLGALIAPRFWCRALCPAGALFSLAARHPAWKRQVTEDCIGCGKCQARCPGQAIPEDPRATRYGECLTCRLCLEICPQQAIRFSFGAATRPILSSQPDPERRALLAGGAVLL
ncbi:MAG: 4Fe-4S binding protein, partial [Deltaproteobacteria bacterium]|nr:4Fe-4S binding protein [Deltaproteobacteria bacterium]